MMRKSLVAILIGIMCILFLAGCSGSKENSDLADKPADVRDTVKTEEAVDEPDDSAEETKETAAEAAEVPTLILHRVNQSEWGDGSSPVIRHRYSYITLEKDQEDALSGLSDSLSPANPLFFTTSLKSSGCFSAQCLKI